VFRIDDSVNDIDSCSLSECIVVVGSRTGLGDLMRRIATAIRPNAVLIDATGGIDEEQQEDTGALTSQSQWTALLPTTRVVRAFASVPSEAFALIVDASAPRDPSDLGVPMTGDDLPAKQLVADLMRQIGVEPFDLGPMTVAYAMDRGGPLWNKAVDAIDMRECIGWLAGDG
jgi:predicted dinucleotide-binding enzyme